MLYCFKSNSAVLNSLLGCVNEKQFDDGSGTPQRIPLISLVSASNELPQGEDLNALFDRLHLRYVVHKIQEDVNLDKLLLMGDQPSPIGVSLKLDEIQAAGRDAQTVRVNPPTIDALKKIRLGLDKQGVVCSDRRLKQLVGIARAEAWLNGHQEIEPGDLAILQHALWNAPEERKKVVDVVFAIACPSMPRALEILDLAAEQRKIAREDPAQVTECFKKVRLLSEEIEKLAKGNGSATPMPQILQLAGRVKDMRKEVGALALA